MDKRKVDVIDIWLAISGGDIHLTSTIRSLMNVSVARARIFKKNQEYFRIFKNIQEYKACNIHLTPTIRSLMNVSVDRARIFLELWTI